MTQIASLPALLPAAELPAVPAVRAEDLYSALLADATKEATAKGRKQDIADLTRELRCATPQAACLRVIAGGAPIANAIATAWRRAMLDRKLSPATINRRLSTLRHLVRLGRRFGVIDWEIEIEGLRVTSYRDTTGPGRSGWVRIHETATREAKWTPKGKRDLALILLLHDHGLRRKEVAGLDVEDWDPANGKLSIVGKGRSEREMVTINARTIVALERWLDARGRDPGPLFCRLDKARPKDQISRLDGDSILSVVAGLGRSAKLAKRARPHGLRHQAITHAIEKTGNLAWVQRFARHADPRTTQRYNDNREDIAGRIAQLLGDD